MYACPGIELPFQSSRAVYFRYPKLDITDASSIEYLAETIKDEEGGVDVLFNNAGLNTARSHTGPSAFADNKKTMDVYFWGTSQVCMTLLPLMRPGGRIVNLSSVASSLQSYSEDLQKRFRNSRMTLLDLQTLAAEYEVEKTMLTAPQTYPNAGTNKEHGWPDSGYAVSKACINAMTAIIARETPSVLINVCCPGWVASDMGRQVALQPPKSASESLPVTDYGMQDIDFCDS